MGVPLPPARAIPQFSRLVASRGWWWWLPHEEEEEEESHLINLPGDEAEIVLSDRDEDRDSVSRNLTLGSTTREWHGSALHTERR